jgi:hypothetical protein
VGFYFFRLAAHQPDKTLAAGFQRLEDIQEIQGVVLDYGRFLNARNFAAYSRLFAKDGEWVGGFGTVQAARRFGLHGKEHHRSQLRKCLPYSFQLQDRRAWRHRHRSVALGLS